jgi:hypothetical protein
MGAYVAQIASCDMQLQPTYGVLCNWENGSRLSAVRLRASRATATEYGMEASRRLKRTRLVKISFSAGGPTAEAGSLSCTRAGNSRATAFGRLWDQHETARCELVLVCTLRGIVVAINHVSIWQRLETLGALTSSQVISSHGGAEFPRPLILRSNSSMNQA